jgi:hypothetical protein
MTENLGLTLQITLIGMGLVFGAIILLWGVMALLMRLTAPRAGVENEAGEDEIELRKRVAAAAVLVAQSQNGNKNELHEFPLPPTALVSAWQAVMRSRQTNKRGPVR